MDEQNEQDDLEKMERNAKKVAKDALRKTVKETGKLAKKALKALIKAIGIKGVIIIIVVLVVVLIIPMFWYGITNSTFEGFSDITNQAINGNNNTENGGISGLVGATGVVTIENRQLKIDVPQLQESLDAWVESNNINKNAFGISNDYSEIKKFIEAQLVTMYPDLRQRDLIGTEVPEGEIQGCIQFNRNYSDGTSELLEYMEYGTFAEKLVELGQALDDNYTPSETILSESEVDAKYNELKNKFTLDAENNLIIVGKSYTRTVIDYSEYAEAEGRVDGDENTYTYTIGVKKVNFQNIVSKYSMPFELELAFLLTTRNSGFTEAIADLAKDSKIVIDIQDNTTTIVGKELYNYTANFKIEKSVSYVVTETRIVEETTTVVDENGVVHAIRQGVEKHEDVTKREYPKTEKTIEVTPYSTTTTTYVNTSIELCVKDVEMWFADYSSEYTNKEETTTTTDAITNEDDEDYIEVQDFHNLNYNFDFPAGSRDHTEETHFYEKQTNKNIAITTTTTSNKYEKVGNGEVTEKPEKFLSLLKINPNIGKFDIENFRNNTELVKYTTINNATEISPENNLLTSQEVLYELLSSNSNTVNLVDIVKYLIGIYEGRIEPGSSGIDFNIYEPGMFRSSNYAYYGGTIKEKVWFALKDLGYSDIAVAGAMGNIDYESGGFNPSIIEGGSGNGIGLCQWSFGRRTSLERYAASKGVEWKDEDTQVEALIAEISGQGPAVDYFGRRTAGYIGDERITGTHDQWQSSTTIHDSTLYFMRFFESPQSKSSLSERERRAQNYYDEFQGREAPISIVTSLTGENRNKMIAMLTEAIRIANDDRYLYSQSLRNTEFFYDCSSFVYRLYSQFFGVSVPTTTASYTGQYRIGTPTQVELQPGDILWKGRTQNGEWSGHVTIYIGDGQYVAAHGREGITGPNQISVYVDNPSNYTYVYRFVT